MKVCHITSKHKIDDVRIYHKEVLSLSQYYNVTLLHNDKDTTKVTEDEVAKIKMKFPKNKVLLNKFLKLYSVSQQALEIDAYIYHLHDPELLLVGNYLKRKNKKVIFDFHEDVEEQIIAKEYIPLIFRRIVSILYRKLEIYFTKEFDAIITATSYIKAKFSNDNRLVEVIKNSPIVTEFEDISLDYTKKEDQVLYVGGISRERGLFRILELASQLPNIQFVFCGDFVYKSDKQKAYDLMSDNVVFKGYLSRKEIVRELEKSKLGLVLLEKNKRYSTSLPIKMFEYMAAGLPVLATNFDLWTKIVNTADSGYVTNPENISEMANIIESLIYDTDLIKTKGLSGRKYIFDKNNWNYEEKKLLNLYKKLEECP